MDNILTITSYPGLDPEIGTAIGYPLMRQISFGGQITFNDVELKKQNLI